MTVGFEARTETPPGDGASRSRRREAVRPGHLRARAIECAFRLIDRDGPEAVHLRDIAAELGTGQASLYYHFENKDALFAEVAAMGFRQLAETVAAGASDDGRPPIRACGDAYLHFIRDHIHLYRLMYSEPLLAGRRVARAAEREAFAAFATLIARSGGAGEDLENAAHALWALGRGLAALAMTEEVLEPGAGRAMARRIVRGLEVLMGRAIRGPTLRSDSVQRSDPPAG